MGPFVDDEALFAVSTMGSLEELSFNVTEHVSCMGLAVLTAVCTSLQKVNLYCYVDINELGLQYGTVLNRR
jgi:hypothetical protein